MVTYFLLCATLVGISHRFWKSRTVAPILHRLWGLSKAREQYEYCKWITTLKTDLVERTKCNKKSMINRLEIVHMPDGKLMRHIVPFRFYLAMGLCAWLISLFILLVVWIFVELQDWVFRCVGVCFCVALPCLVSFCIVLWVS